MCARQPAATNGPTSMWLASTARRIPGSRNRYIPVTFQHWRRLSRMRLLVREPASCGTTRQPHRCPRRRDTRRGPLAPRSRNCRRSARRRPQRPCRRAFIPPVRHPRPAAYLPPRHLGAVAATQFGGENPARSVVEAAGDTISGSAASSIETELSGVISASGPATVALGLVGALWTGGLAMGTVVKALDRIQHTEERRPRLQRWLVTAFLTVVAGLLFVGATVGIVLTGVFADSITGWLGVGDVPWRRS
ncbi:MAG: YhjD/YihY/BrkB family envelope integrity protein [Dehalococcoidia bacterium]|nr:YhjD/YihY/BrkB family envelope integrity protein [Dehalococcoidia bacterium]